MHNLSYRKLKEGRKCTEVAYELDLKNCTIPGGPAIYLHFGGPFLSGTATLVAYSQDTQIIFSKNMPQTYPLCKKRKNIDTLLRRTSVSKNLKGGSSGILNTVRKCFLLSFLTFIHSKFCRPRDLSCGVHQDDTIATSAALVEAPKCVLFFL